MQRILPLLRARNRRGKRLPESEIIFLQELFKTNRKKRKVACAVSGSAGLIAAAQIVDEHLLDGLVISDGDVADGASADEVANFFG
jgi:hypothetical protein